MQKKQANFNPTKITRDLAVSVFKNDSAYEIVNMRLVSTGGNTTLCLVNEKSNSKELDIKGTVVGVQELKDKIILFVTDEKDLGLWVDCIYQITEDENGNLKSTKLYEGQLGFSIENPIESVGIYENEKIEKVYWVDGKNQARMVNIHDIKRNSNTQFDFSPSISNIYSNTPGTITISVSPNFTNNGNFNPGVIQYAVCYFNKYGQQGNIITSSPLFYLTDKGRGLNPDGTQKSSESFDITINKPAIDETFPYSYVRLYRLQRTSLENTPMVESVRDFKISELPTSFCDNGSFGVTEDPSILLYAGGDTFTPKTLTHKDGVLFLGNLKVDSTHVDNAIKKAFEEHCSVEYRLVNTSEGIWDKDDQSILDTQWSYKSSLAGSNAQITYFQKGEVYRFGVQLLHQTGVWTEVIYIADKENPLRVVPNIYADGIKQRPLAFINIDMESIKESLSDELKSKLDEFVSIRPLCVYPTINDRNVLCQGIVCPTVYNVKDRQDNSPYAQSSWFARPRPFDITKKYSADARIHPSTNYIQPRLKSLFDGGILRWNMFAPNYPRKEDYDIVTSDLVSYLPDSLKINGEILGAYGAPNSSKDYTYGVEERIVTLHSPELDQAFDETMYNLALDNVKFRVVGYAPVKTTFSNLRLNSKNLFEPQLTEARGLEDIHYDSSQFPPPATEYYATYKNSPYSLINFPFWIDAIAIDDGDKIDTPGFIQGGNKGVASFPVYPWHRSGSLNNQGKADDSKKRSVLENKILSNLRICSPTQYIEDERSYDISNIELFNEDFVANKTLNIWDKKITYRGNIDTIVPYLGTSTMDYGLNSAGIYSWTTYQITSSGTPTYIDKSKLQNIETTEAQSSTEDYISLRDLRWSYSWGIKDANIWNSDPVPIQYKSTGHAVFAFSKTIKQVPEDPFPKPDEGEGGITPMNSLTTPREVYNILPLIRVGEGSSSESFYLKNNKQDTPVSISGRFYWLQEDEKDKMVNSPFRGGVQQDVINIDRSLVEERGYEMYFVVGEFYRDNVVNRFGGDSEEAKANNMWHIAGEATTIDKVISGFSIECDQGDTYYQRYDHIKTYPYADTCVNSIVDIPSFCIETRINIDGRYDKNRGNKDNTYIDPTNFNLFNKVYTQKNSFFNVPYLRTDDLDIVSFPNQVVWSLTKTLGETIDTWANITMANILDLDGDKGEVRALRRYNNELFSFQDRGISKILYNERAQINATDGIPIEISNSGRVSGKYYITDKYGCINKWSITETPSGLYFIDDANKSLINFDGKSFTDISEVKGMYSWVINDTYNKEWTIKDKQPIRTLFDRITKDIYFTTPSSALSFNEKLKEFTSFYSYGNVDWLFTLGKNSYQIWNSSIYKIHGGTDYMNFFGKNKSYSVNIIANPDFIVDKVFDTLEFRTNTTEKYDIYKANTYPFNSMITSNEYQKSIADTSTLKKKFRTFRWQIGRDGNKLKGDRIRNPWASITLSGDSNKEMRLYDCILSYYV